MALAVIKRLSNGILPAAVLFALLLVSLYLLSYATEQSDRFENLYEWMLLINAVGLLVLATLIGINLYRLVRQYRANVVGSRMTVRLFVMFVVLAVVPVSVVYYFSLQFLQRGIDSWFDVEVEKPLQDALELSQAALDLRKRELLQQTVELADELGEVTDDNAAVSLNDLRGRVDAAELTLIGANSHIIAFASAESTMVVPSRPSEDVMLQLRQGRSYVSLEPVSESGLQVRVAVLVPTTGRDSRYLQAVYSVPQRLDTLAESVQSSFAQYKTLAFQREPLKKSFLLSLSLVLLLSLLAAVWAAFFSTRRLVAPIRDLAEGTQAVAAGHYDKRLPPAGPDELGFLVRSFNQMTERLAESSSEAQRSQQQVEEQRAYLETVLANLSSGVLTVDRDNVLRTANAAAGQILGIGLDAYLGRSLVHVVADYPHIKRLIEALAPHLAAGEPDWSEEVLLFAQSGRQILMCRGTNLPGESGGRGDHVMVFDDVTTLVQAQRDAAWAEVARRLAHEIKNPLTPIQLSAERLRRKFLEHMSEQDAQLLDRATHTIVQQVEAMKAMVNAFSEYARAPQIQLLPLNLNGLISEVLDLYSELTVHLDLDEHSPRVEADSGRLRQLLHNLIRNSLEAVQGGEARIDISTRSVDDRNSRFVEMAVRDYGPGFPDEARGALFEPYVTTKPKGTGLGLAIVKKIVEEHNGVVWAENLEQGARVVIRLPVVAAARAVHLQVLPAAGSEGGQR